ncbi:hypothetical protein PUN28_017218 [Cardiocondyla obscurior]|uniref:Uncharacterized protein n=1 Tax=Cardiocondyla obscurior TaxID=286306 RepID=A0AAW2ER79_9HYME
MIFNNVSETLRACISSRNQVARRLQLIRRTRRETPDRVKESLTAGSARFHTGVVINGLGARRFASAQITIVKKSHVTRLSLRVCTSLFMHSPIHTSHVANRSCTKARGNQGVETRR